MNLLQTLNDAIANTVQGGSTGLPVVELKPGDLAMDQIRGKCKAAIGFTVVTEDGSVVTDELDLLLSTEPEAVDLGLQVHLVVASDRVGLSAGEIMEAIKKALSKRGIRVGENWTVGFQLEEQKHVEYDQVKKADHFSAIFAMVLIKHEEKAAK